MSIPKLKKFLKGTKNFMIIMSIDLGEVRTGLAACDKSETLAYPLGTIAEKNKNNLAAKILEKANEIKAEMIVIGLPKNMDGSLGKSAQNSAEFKKLLESQTNLPIVSWDERRTTIAAANYLNETNTRGKKRKSVIDTLSASIILESFLNYRKNNFSAT